MWTNCLFFWFFCDFIFYSLKIILLTSSSCGVQTGSVSESANSSGSAMASSVATAFVVLPNTAILFVLALRKHCSRLGGKFKGSIKYISSNIKFSISYLIVTKMCDLGARSYVFLSSTTALLDVQKKPRF